MLSKCFSKPSCFKGASNFLPFPGYPLLDRRTPRGLFGLGVLVDLVSKCSALNPFALSGWNPFS